MIQLPPDFKEFLRLLNSNNVRYLVVGGYAVNHYGYSRATADLDIWIDRTGSDIDRLEALLRDFGFPDASATLLRQPDRVIRMGLPPLRLELLTSISGCEFDSCYQRRMAVNWDGLAVSLLGLDDLRRNKQASGRLRDQLDLENLD